MLKSVLKVRNALVKVYKWAEREEELSIICLKMVVKAIFVVLQP